MFVLGRKIGRAFSPQLRARAHDEYPRVGDGCDGGYDGNYSDDSIFSRLLRIYQVRTSKSISSVSAVGILLIVPLSAAARHTEKGSYDLTPPLRTAAARV